MNNLGALFARVTKVMQTVKALEPDKKHQQGYMYISSDKVLQAIGGAMSQHGLVIIPSVTGQAVDIVEYTNNQGKPMTRFDASVTFAMTLADSDGNDHTAIWVGSGTDFTSPDKAIYKAITSGHKYFMLKLFVVGAGNEDSEHEEAEPGYAKQTRPSIAPVVPAQSRPVNSPFTPGKSIIYRGEHDEKAGVVVEDSGNGLVLVRVGEKEFKAKRERLTLAPDFAELGRGGVPATQPTLITQDTGYTE